MIVQLMERLKSRNAMPILLSGKIREGQTKGLLYGAKLAKYPIIVTIDSDLENPPELIPEVVAKLRDVDVVVASRRVLPRFSERWAAKTLGKMCDVSDFYSNFRAYRRDTIVNAHLVKGETFGGELLVDRQKERLPNRRSPL